MIDKDMNSACMQGGSVRPVNNYQQQIMMEPRSPHTAWQINTTGVAKHQPMDEDKNDSGVASGSDFHSSSPGSDTSQDLQHPYRSPQTQNTQTNRFYSTPMLPQAMAMFGMNPYSHNPLTPPNSEPLVSPKSEKEEKDMDSTLTPCSSPHLAKTEEHDHLRRLEISLEKNLHLSSKNSEHSMDGMSNKSDNDAEDYIASLRVPKVNSHGKVKTFKCKQCDFVANTKIDQWNHSKIHIPEEKRLTCHRCPFVTEYKHHLEYHLRNHAGSKPFQCKKCDYSCVNKSMLNSHLKSHSNVYRFSCHDCSYATKYCHSLKLHLRRYGHSPSVVLDEEGNPSPDTIIDVYGTRRGPKVKTATKNEERPARRERLPFGLDLMSSPQQLPFPVYPFFNAFPNPHMLQKIIQERQALVAATTANNSPASPVLTERVAESDMKVLDLSKPGSSVPQHKNRRKGPAFRVDPSTVNDSEEEEEDEEMSTTVFDNVEVVQNQDEKQEDVVSSESNVADSNNNNGGNKNCQYCNIDFGDDVLYSIHMGYHGFHNPFTCNMCGTECSDKVSFFLHIARVSHS